MNKKKLLIALAAFLAVLAGAGYYWYKTNYVDDTKDIGDVTGVLQPVYGTLLWTELCKKNNISYNEELIEQATGLYKELIEDREIGDSTDVYNLALYIGNKKMMGYDVSEYISLLKENYFDPETSLYCMFSKKFDDVRDVSVAGTMSALRWFERCGLGADPDIIKGLEKYYNAKIDSEDIEKGDESTLITLADYFWGKDKCSGIQLNNKTKELFSEGYNRIVNGDMYPSDLSNEKYMDICDALGIDTSELRKKMEGWNLMDGPVENWKIWSDNNESTAALASALYFDALSDPDNYLKDSELFCSEYGKGLDDYCEKFLIPRLTEMLQKPKG